MSYKLKDAKITHISLVDKGANGVPFAIIKEAGKVPIQKEIRIAKTDEDKQVVLGVVYQPDTPDAHDDQMTAGEIEKAAHLFMQDQHTYNIDKQHDLDADKGYVVESYIAPCEMTIGDQVIAKGSWVAGVKVTDTDTWDSIKKGEITGFSMWGIGKREEIDADTEVSKGLFHQIKKAVAAAVAPIIKGTVANKYHENRTRREFWAVQDALNSVLFRWDSWDAGMETDPEMIREALQDFVDIAQDVLVQDDIVKAIGKPPEEIAKAGKKISTGNMQHIDDALAALTELKNKTVPADDEQGKEEDDLKPEDIAKAVAAAMEPIAKQVGDLAAQVTELKKEEGADQGELQEAGVTPEQTALTEAIAKAMNPLTEQMQSLADEVQLMKNARGGSHQGGEGEEQIQKSQSTLSRFI